jgi:hypothetical protein
MSMPFVRRWIIAALCVGLGLLGGCGVLRLGYGQADAFAFRWLDGYADFDDAQSLRVREGLNGWFGWHRRTQLPDYADLLSRIEPEVRRDTTAERVCEWWSQVRERIDRGLDAAVPTFVELAPTLRREQLEHIERRYAKANAEYREEFLNPDPRRRLVATAKRVAGRAEWLYGDLDDAQRTRIAEWVQESPFDPVAAYEERLRRQEEGLALLRRLGSAPLARETAAREVREWLGSFDRSPRLPHRLRTERLVRHNCALAAALHNSTSPAQREAASKRLRDWAADFRALAAEGGG